MLREISTFKDLHVNFPRPQSSETSSSWLIKDYTDEDFYKLI